MKRTLLAAAAVVASVAFVPPALGTPPTRLTVTQESTVDNPTACGSYGVLWDINLTARITNYFNSQGRRVRQTAHIKEDNTISRISTTGEIVGPTLREGPDSFTQTIYFNPNGTINRIVATGLQARVGNEVKDVGRVVLLPLGGGRFDLVFAAGQHPVREAADLGTLRDALPAFCDVLA
jgi:hypothetical protein